MRYGQSFIVLLSFLLVAVTLVIPVSSDGSPPYPDDGNIDSFKEWMDQWKIDNMDPASEKVGNSYRALEGLVGDYKAAINGVGAVAFSAVSGVVQDKWVGLVMSVYGTSKDAARAIAKTQTLQEAVEEAASDHSLYFYYYNDLFDKHRTVDQGIVFGKINHEIATLGGMLVQAETMMEAYYRYEYLIILYNRQVEAWNTYAPSRPVSSRWTTVPSKVLFEKFSCFGGCGYDHDTLDYARDTHKTKCGTAKNIDEVLQDAPILLTQVHSTALQRRTVDHGCGRPYYVCRPEQVLQHHAWTCHVIGCSVKYRNCLTHTRDHSNHGTSGAEAPSTPPTSGSLLMAACNIHDTSVSGSHSSAGCGTTGHFACDSLTHQQEQCTRTHANGNRCTYTFWRCSHPTVPANGPLHTHVYPVAPPLAVFTPSLSLTYSSSINRVYMSANASEPIYGADLYVRFPGNTSKYGTKIGWTSGNSNGTTYVLPVNYSFPSPASSGTYKFTLRVYPFNNSGSGYAWGDPYDVFENVTVE